MKFFEKLRRCKFCRHDMTDEVTSDSYRQNPYCDQCDAERTSAIISARGPAESCMVGGYMYLRPIAQTQI